MRLIVAIAVALLVTGCSAGVAATPTATPVTPEAPLLASDGGVLRPVENGGRVAMQHGYATVRMWPSPQSMDPRLEVVLFDDAGKPAAAEVWVVYEMMDMEHGVEQARGRFEDDRYKMFLSFGMQGSWKLVVHVARSGSEEKLMLVLPWVGL